MLGSTPRVSDSGDLGLAPRFALLTISLGDADAAGPCTTFGPPMLYPSSSHPPMHIRMNNLKSIMKSYVWALGNPCKSDFLGLGCSLGMGLL